VSDVALVTGAASGLGAAMARALHGAGYRVVITDVDGAGAEALAVELDGTGETALGMVLDVRDGAAIEAVADAVTRRWGGCRCWSTMRC
jgi:3-oxoacyl-[acyl-carrier protein] reductase